MGIEMNYEKTGLVLFTKYYDECVTFYSTKLELPIQKVLDDQYSKLTVLRFGFDTYLTIETGGFSSSILPKKRYQNPVCLRFNVTSVDESAQKLSSKGVEVTVRREPWGTVGDFMDPDGNVCSFTQEQLR